MKCKMFYTAVHKESEKNDEERRDNCAYVRNKIEQEFLDQDGKTIRIRKIMETPNYSAFTSYYYDEIKPHTKQNKINNYHI